MPWGAGRWILLRLVMSPREFMVDSCLLTSYLLLLGMLLRLLAVCGRLSTSPSNSVLKRSP